MALIDDIREVVHQNAGGIKMIGLTSRLLESGKYHPQWEDNWLDDIEVAIYNSPDLNILEYLYQLSDDTVRMKQFVYYKPKPVATSNETTEYESLPF